MTAAAPAAAAATTAATGDHHEGEHIHEARHYIKMWAILCVLLVVSFVGPLIAPSIFGAGPSTGKLAMVLMTAFGIAVVKAYIVCAYFMHLNIEKKLAAMLLVTTLALMGLFFSGVAPDVMKHQGHNWSNDAAKLETSKRIEREGEHGEKLEAKIKAMGHGGGGGGAEHGKPEKSDH